jgi:hypothetical protein
MDSHHKATTMVVLNGIDCHRHILHINLSKVRHSWNLLNIILDLVKRIYFDFSQASKYVSIIFIVALRTL